MVNSDPAQMSAVMLQWMQTLEWRSVTAVEYRIANNSIVCITACSGWQQRKIRAPQYWLFFREILSCGHDGFPSKKGPECWFVFPMPWCHQQNNECKVSVTCPRSRWWRHQMETFSALLALCAGNSPVTGEFSAQRPVTQIFDVFFIYAGIKCWVNIREAGDLRRHRAHCDFIVMMCNVTYPHRLHTWEFWVYYLHR